MSLSRHDLYPKKERPCYNCTERVTGCHQHCERYNQNKVKEEEIKRKIKVDKEKNSTYITRRINY